MNEDKSKKLIDFLLKEKSELESKLRAAEATIHEQKLIILYKNRDIQALELELQKSDIFDGVEGELDRFLYHSPEPDDKEKYH